MYQNPYMNNYTNFNQQSMNERIDNQIAQLQQMKEQMKNNQQQPIPTNLTQNFQIAPTNHEIIKYADSIEEVKRNMVIGDTPYFSKNMSIVWIKNTKGEIKTYELNEIIPKDERDLLIESLQMQVAELRKEIKDNAKSINNYDDESIKNETTSNVSVNRASTKKSKQSDGNV